MAGGTLIVLGRHLEAGQAHPCRYVGTGMHGGAIYLRGTVDPTSVGREVGIVSMTGEDHWMVQNHVRDFAHAFALDPDTLLDRPFVKLVPLTKRPYGRLYAY